MLVTGRTPGSASRGALPVQVIEGALSVLLNIPVPGCGTTDDWFRTPRKSAWGRREPAEAGGLANKLQKNPDTQRRPRGSGVLTRTLQLSHSASTAVFGYSRRSGRGAVIP